MRLAMTLAALSAAIAAPSPGSEPTGASGKECEMVRILPDGREQRSRAKSGAASAAAVSADGRSARSSGSASGSTRSSVSVSSSSSSVGGGSARATSSYTDDEGRTVTTTRDERGCTIVIDERG